MSENDRNIDTFIRLLTRHQGQIYSYILSLVGNFNDSEDVLQETSSKLWELFDQYEPGTDFLKWSLSVAYYRVLEYRRKAKRVNKLIYGDDFFSQISDSAPNQLSQTRVYLDKLKYCIDKLLPEDASLVKMRFHHAMPVKEIASRIDRTARNVYFSLARIQHLLLRCIEKG